MISNRPLLCLSTKKDLIAVGCADHSVYIISQNQTQQLHTKNFGHHDWVTNVAFDNDDLISVGVDGIIARWEATTFNYIPKKMVQTNTSITKLILDSKFIYISTYAGLFVHDKFTLERIFDYKINAPVLDFYIQEEILICSDRKGRIFEINLLSNVADKIQAHNGRIVKIVPVGNRKVASVGDDDYLRIFDLTKNRNKGRRIVNLELKMDGINGMIVADDRKLFITGRNSILYVESSGRILWKIEFEPTIENCAYSTEYLLPGVVAVGWGNGDISIFYLKEFEQERIATSLSNALRAMKLENGKIIAVGDDGSLETISVKLKFLKESN